MYNYATQLRVPGGACNTPGVASSVRSARMRSNPIPLLTPRQENRFWSQVEVHHPAGCWEWTGPPRDGYGRISIQYVSYQAHRLAYLLLIGPISEGMTLDHLCRNRLCVNPDHLQPTTNAENLRRGFGVSAQNARKTHCKRGHELDDMNVYWWHGFRHCRACNASRMREARRKNKRHQP